MRRVNEKPDSRNTKGTVKYGGGSLMVWACIAHTGVGKIHLIDGNLNAHQYVEILLENLAPSIETPTKSFFNKTMTLNTQTGLPKSGWRATAI